MKAMLDPRMVAASIHVLVVGPGRVPTAVDRITASSQGVLIRLWMPFLMHEVLKISECCREGESGGEASTASA
jgi:hypothetical protein